MIPQSRMSEVVDISKVEFVNSYKYNKKFKGVEKEGEKTCSKCKQSKLLSSYYHSKYLDNNRRSSCIKCSKADKFKESRRIKLKCMLGYGGKCVCCGETTIEMLCIEHIKNKRFKLIYESHTITLMKKLIKLGFPKGHTILCYGCNSFTKNGIPCVHSKEYKEYYDENIKPYKYARQKELDELEHKWAVMNGKASK